MVDLHEMLLVPGIVKQTCLWENPYGDLMAYAIVDTWNNLWFDLWADFLGTPLEVEIVQWGVSCIRSQAREEGNSSELNLDTNCDVHNQQRISMLLRQGFIEKPQCTLQLVRRLSDPFPAMSLPSGFYLRTVNDESEADDLAALHRAAFASDEMTADYRRFMMQVPGYDPSLDLVVTAPDGRPAAFCVCQVDAESGGREGFTDPLGTHPDHLRMGLAKALLLEGLRRLKSRGVEVARLSTDSINVAMLKTADSVGFKLEKTKLWFSKPVPNVGAKHWSGIAAI